MACHENGLSILTMFIETADDANDFRPHQPERLYDNHLYR